MPNRAPTHHSKPLRVGVVGVGYIGKFHAKIYAQMAAVELVAVLDIDQQVGKKIASRYGCEAVGSIAELLERVDAVSIVVPTTAHLPVTKPFLEKGIHVLLEKPIAPSVRESEQVVALAEQHGVLLQIGHLERFNAGVMKLAEMAGAPRFIEVHRLGPYVPRATDVDVITDLMIHDIDIVLSLIKSDLNTISANGSRVITQHVDIANARLEFANGAVANVTASRVSSNQFRRIRVFSDAHYLGLNFVDQQLEEIRPAETPSDSDVNGLQRTKIAVTPQRPLDAELAHFVDCVRNRTPPLVDGQDGLRAVRVAERVREKIADSMQWG